MLKLVILIFLVLPVAAAVWLLIALAMTAAYVFVCERNAEAAARQIARQ